MNEHELQQYLRYQFPKMIQIKLMLFVNEAEILFAVIEFEKMKSG